MEDGFVVRIRHIAQLLSFEQDVSSYNPYEVAAARIYLKDQEQGQPSDPSEIQGPDSYQ